MYFNPRSHERSDEIQLASHTDYPLFQSTLPREERRELLQVRRTDSLFQSTLPREERRQKATYKPCTNNFNPRSHERSDFLVMLGTIKLIISIHAPTRGATVNALCIINNNWFQSTLPREERRRTDSLKMFKFSISIHAPTRGATITADLMVQYLLISIHAPTRGATWDHGTT